MLGASRFSRTLRLEEDRGPALLWLSLASAMVVHRRVNDLGLNYVQTVEASGELFDSDH